MCLTQYFLLLVALILQLTHSWDIAVTAGDRLEFYTINGTNTDTVRFDSQNLTAIVYDEIHNTLLYVDKQSDNDTICGYNITSVEYKCLIERNGRSIQGLAFDPVTEMLFFTDIKERSINWISLKPGSENKVYGNLLLKMADGIPTDIAVDSCRGHIYWINSNRETISTIERARFDGSEREVVIQARNNDWDLHSLAFGYQSQKIYWFASENNITHRLYSADLSGNHQDYNLYIAFSISDKTFVTHPNTLTISKEFLVMMDWSITQCPRSIWKFLMPEMYTHGNESFFKVHTESPVGIAAKYKISEQIEGVQTCKALKSLAPNDYMTDDSFKIAREYVEPFCEHGIKVTGQSLCKCTPGYTGKGCDVSVCQNYCLHGNCSFSEEGLPECRCNSGYNGERCEVNVCHGYCLNNGTCSLDEEDDPVCQCIDHYAGDRCQISDRLSTGHCPLNEQGSRCKADKDNMPTHLSTTPTHFTTERNLTLADILANRQKPVTTISVVVEVKSN